MKKLIAIALLALPFGATADHIDVIEFKLNDGCSFAKYLEIVKDFNSQFGAKHGYKAEVFSPIQSNNMTSLFWVGRTKDTTTFGKGWDTWRTNLNDPNSVESKLWARFLACSTNLSRRAYDTY